MQVKQKVKPHRKQKNQVAAVDDILNKYLQ